MDEQQSLPLDSAPDAPADDFVVASSGVPDPEPDALTPVPGEAAADASSGAAATRNADGTFKAKGKPRNDPQARVEQATGLAAEAKREREAAQKERDDARAEAARYKQELDSYKAPRRETPAPAPRAAAAPDDPEPNANDTAKYPGGEYDGRFLKDQARWEARKEVREFQAQQQAAQRQQQQTQYRQQVESTYTDRIAKAKAADPTFETRLKKDAPFNLDLLPHFMTLEDAPDLLIYLSEHLDDAQRLAALPPTQAVGFLGKLSGRLEAARTRGPAPTPVSKATAPIQPLGGGASGSGYDEGSDDEPLEVFFKRENDRERQRRAGR